jgi:ABC-type sugar transport system ATPase subunit
MNLVPAPVIGAGAEGTIAGFRPEHVRLGNGKPDALHFEALVEVVEYLGDEQIAHAAINGTEVVAKLPVEHRLAAERVETFTVPRDKLYLFDATTEQAVPA